ncbi:hypothetical protein A3732_25210 [Oleiphilus sp. HI0050]|nr:hypothetical protein A3732_25210 [Oleiphilus sp. HI0050]
MLVPKDIRLSQLNAVKIPEGIDDATVRSTLLNQYDLELGAGLGKFAGKAWRIGLMGNGCNRKNVDYCVSSLGAVLNELGHSCDVDAAMSAVENAYP